MSAPATTLAAYERWAPLYPPAAHNPLMRAEQHAMLELWPEVAGLRVLDLACGTGRYTRILRQRAAALVVAADFCRPMLAQVADAARVCASMTCLPFAAECFDVVVCGLAVGHAANIDIWMREVVRVLRPGGTLLYSDFHPAAARAGLPRSFRDAAGRTWHVPHSSHSVRAQRRAATAAGLELDEVRELRVGTELRAAFPGTPGAGAPAVYGQWHGLPVVLVVRARK
jgi:malonyl-CoA O-methyltransferase